MACLADWLPFTLATAMLTFALLCPASVGIVSVRGGASTLVAKQTFYLGEPIARVVDPPEPLSADIPCPYAPDERFYPSDFARSKPLVDVLLAGRAKAPIPASVLPARLVVGNLDKRFYAHSAQPAMSIPLSPTYLRSSPLPPGQEAVRVGPLPSVSDEQNRNGQTTSANVAPEDQRIQGVDFSAPIRLEGLVGSGAPFESRLEGRRLRAFLVQPNALREEATELVLACDTIFIDVDRLFCMLVYRAILPEKTFSGADPINRPYVVVASEAAREMTPWPTFRAALSQARWVTDAPVVVQEQPVYAVRRPIRRQTEPVLAAVKPPQGKTPLGGLPFFAKISAEAPRRAEPTAEEGPDGDEPTRRMSTSSLFRPPTLPFQPPVSREPQAPQTPVKKPYVPFERPMAGREVTSTFIVSPKERAAILPFAQSAAERKQEPAQESPPKKAPYVPFERAAPDRETTATFLTQEPDRSAVLPFAQSPAVDPAPLASPPREVVEKPNLTLGQTTPLPLAPEQETLYTRHAAPGVSKIQTPDEAKDAVDRAGEPLLSLETFAAIKTDLWSGVPLREALARHGVDQRSYHLHERKQKDELAEELARGKQERTRALREALRKARARASASMLEGGPI